MENKQTQNGEVKVRNTTRLQLKSLDLFAKRLGYLRGKDNQYRQPTDFSSWVKSKPCISFNTMVKWHNGNFGHISYLSPLKHKIQEKTGIPLNLLEQAFNSRKVLKVKIQRKKDTTLVVQDHLVKKI